MIRLFRVSIPTSIVLLVLSETVLLFGCYIAAAFYALDPTVYPNPWFYFYYEGGWGQVTFVVVTLQLGLYLMDLYDKPFPRSRMELLQQLSLVLGMAFLFQALVGYGEWGLLQLPQWTMVYGSVLTMIVIPLWRTGFGALVRKALPAHRIVFVGCPLVVREIASEIEERPETGYRVIGYVGEPDSFGAIPRLGGVDELESLIATHQPQSVVVGEDLIRLPLAKLLELKVSGVQLEPALGLYEAVFGRIPVRSLPADQLVFSSQFGPRPWTLQAQTLYSYLLGVAGLILALPLILPTAILVKLSSPGPVLYRQKRVGLRGQPFFLYKFRSMYVDAEARTGPVWAVKNDPRITPIGRWMRSLRLDELPQFFNVLRGEMALVGPRPERPEFCTILEEKIPYFHQRHLVKPGITGWAQINHKYGDTIEDSVTKLEYDLYYIKHLAPSLDAFILFHTIKVMLLSRGAQ